MSRDGFAEATALSSAPDSSDDGGDGGDDDDCPAASFTSTIVTLPELLHLMVSWITNPIDLVTLTATSCSLRKAALLLLNEAWLLRIAPDFELPEHCKPTFVAALPDGTLAVSNSTKESHQVLHSGGGLGYAVSNANVMLLRAGTARERRMVQLDRLDSFCVKRQSFCPSGLAVMTRDADDPHRDSRSSTSLLVVDCASPSAVIEQPIDGGIQHPGSSTEVLRNNSHFAFDDPQLRQLQSLTLDGIEGLRCKVARKEKLDAEEKKMYDRLQAAEALWWDSCIADTVDDEERPPRRVSRQAVLCHGHFLDYPLGVAIGQRTGRIFVVDSDHHRIVALAPPHAPSPRGHSNSTPQEGGAVLVTDSSILFEFGRSGPGQLQDPFDVAAHDGRIYVTDSGHHRICVYGEEDGSFIRSICDRRSTSASALSQGRGVAALLRPGHVLRLGHEVTSDKVPWIRGANEYRTFWSRFDDNPGRAAEAKDDFLTSLNDPSGVTIYRGRLVVAMSGGRLLVLSSGALEKDPAAPVFVEQVVHGKGRKGSSGVCVDGYGRLLVANYNRRLLHVLQPIT